MKKKMETINKFGTFHEDGSISHIMNENGFVSFHDTFLSFDDFNKMPKIQQNKAKKHFNKFNWIQGKRGYFKSDIPK